jgi:hypothetical protein
VRAVVPSIYIGCIAEVLVSKAGLDVSYVALRFLPVTPFFLFTRALGAVCHALDILLAERLQGRRRAPRFVGSIHARPALAVHLPVQLILAV